MHTIFQLFLCLLLCSYWLFAADWNQTFDEESLLLLQELPLLQQTPYAEKLAHFLKKREKLLKNESLKNTLLKRSLQSKFYLFLREQNLILKKRRNNHIHDCFAWELSYLLNAPDYVTPSFPVEIGGKRVIIQPLETFEVGKGKEETHTEKAIQSISLETYWKAHFVAYLLGLADLAGRNIGITPKGQIRFFDTEIALSYFNTPTKTPFSFTTGYILQSFDWPQYRKPLDKKTAEHLKKFILSLAHFEEHVQVYKERRHITIPEEALLFRLSKVRSFPLEEGRAFRDFFGYTCPRMSEGLDRLNRIVGAILNRKVDHGSTLFFTCRWMKTKKLTAQQNQEIQEWIIHYIR